MRINSHTGERTGHLLNIFMGKRPSTRETYWYNVYFAFTSSVKSKKYCVKAKKKQTSAKLLDIRSFS